MAEYLLPDLEISVENQQEDINKLLNIIKPTWKIDGVKTEQLSGGYSCRMFRCYEDKDPDDSVTFRIRNHLDKFFERCDKELEMRMIQHLSKNGHFPKIYAVFSNGYCYQFIKGRPVMDFRKKEFCLNDDIFTLGAKKLAYIHSVKFDDLDYTSDKCFRFCNALINSIPNESKPSKETLATEMNMLREYYDSKGSHITICHGDAYFGNLIWNEENGTVTYIDWEMCNIGYQLGDIAYLLIHVELMENFYMDTSTEKSAFSPEYQRSFVRVYIDSLNEIQNNGKKITEEELTHIMDEIEGFKLVAFLIFIAYPLAVHELMEEVTENTDEFLQAYIKEYLNLKEKIFGKKSFELINN